MALPILNETIKYDLIIPSNKQAITYRPYLVKEEKVLLQAFESNDRKIQMRAKQGKSEWNGHQRVVDDTPPPKVQGRWAGF